MNKVEGKLVANGAKIGIVAASFKAGQRCRGCASPS